MGSAPRMCLSGRVTLLRIGHRGAAGTRPELTRSSFERAIALGCDMIELDVQLTRDRRLVVLHDRRLGRTVAGRGTVRRRSLDELRALDAGAWFGSAYAGEPVLSLDDVLDLTRGRVDLNVEIKSPQADWVGTADVLADLLRRHRRLGSTIVSCFDPGALHCLRAREPRARLGVLWEGRNAASAWPLAAALSAVSIHPKWTRVNAGFVAAAHRRELLVLAWTVNDPTAMERLAALGVDGIISDYPERIPLRAHDRLDRPGE